MAFKSAAKWFAQVYSSCLTGCYSMAGLLPPAFQVPIVGLLCYGFDMSLLFGPKKRMRTSRPLAVALNVLNILAPVLLALAVALISLTKVRDCAPAVHRLLILWAAALVAAALAMRVVWAICIRMIRRQKNGSQGPGSG